MTRVRLFLLLCLWALCLPCRATQSVTLVWNPSFDTNVSGYNIYYGVGSRAYTNVVDVGNVLTCTITGLVEGVTYYFAATAYNVLGMESDFSNECAYTVPTAGITTPGPPGPLYIAAIDLDMLAWEEFRYGRRRA